LQDRLDRATADFEPPFAAVDLEAFDANADDLLRRAGGRASDWPPSRSAAAR
jgi:D-serine deaminase-like pyridoxal phosphate-dependent protein